MLTSDLYDKYKLARWAYAVGEPIMSDMEYNDIHARLKVEMPDDEYVCRSWSSDPCPVELLVRFNRMDLYRDISIEYTSESMDSLRSDDEVKSWFAGLNEKTRVSYKVDGWNNQVNYYNGSLISVNTRGRSSVSKDSSVIADVVPNKIPMMGKVKVIGEASIPNNKWKEFQELYSGKDQRASMSTVIAQNLTEYLSFKAFTIVSHDNQLPDDKYELLSSWGFETPKFMMVSNYSQLLSAIKMLGMMDDKNDVLTDGLVIENSSIQMAVRVGKWQESAMCSYVTGYIENVTPYGISMTLGVKPVMVGGKNVSVLSITNLNQIVSNNLQIGYPVAFALRSSANPVIDTVKTQELQERWFDMYDEYVKRIDDAQLFL